MARSWGLHAIVLVLVLAGSLAAIGHDAPSLAMVVAFFWMPLAVVYTAVSTALVAFLRPGRARVALAHVIAIALGVLAPLFFVTGRSSH